MSILKYLDNYENTIQDKKSNIEYLNIISELHKEEIIDLSCYTILNNFVKSQSIININYIINILNSNIKEKNNIEKIKNTFDNLFEIKNNKLKLNNEIYNKLIDNQFIHFSNNQQEALKTLLKFISDENQKTFGLYGYAGTGKTTTLVEFIAYLIENKYIKSVALSAPTNKAVNIIKSKFRYHLKRLAKISSDNYTFDDLIDILDRKGIKIDFITIHKLLNYKNDFDTEGDRIFLRGEKTNLDIYDLVIIDECSMIPFMIINNIFEDIRNITNKTTNLIKFPKILFSGDICQLPPVNEIKSIIFFNIFKNINLKDILKYDELKKYYDELQTQKGKNKFKIDFDSDYYNKLIENLQNELITMNHFTLTEVVRSKLSNVINLCYNIREWIDNIVKYPMVKKYLGKGVHVYKNDAKEKIQSAWFKKYMEYHESTKPEYSSNIILSWTNRQCDYYNNSIRSIIFKDKKNINKYEIGDILILNDFYILDEVKETNLKKKSKEKDNSNRFYTSEQIKIIELEIVNKKSDSFTDSLPKYLIKLKNIEKIETKFKQIINKINNFLQKEYKCWKIFVKKLNDINNENINNDKEEISDNSNILYVIHDESIKILENNKMRSLEEIRKLKKELKNNPDYSKTIERYILKQLWKEWNKIFNEPFANVNIGCSISCHKSQSSTYFNVFVDADDILNNPNNDEAKRCMYTALTRASNEIHILI
jgi:hypothetical protein